MSNEKFSQLPTVTLAKLTDVFAAVQDGVSVKETLAQLVALITSGDFTLADGEFISGSPSGGFAGALLMYSNTAANGALRIHSTDSPANFSMQITNAPFGQPCTITIPDPVNNNANFILSNFSGAQHVTSGSFQVDAGTLISGLPTASTAGRLVLYSPTATSGSLDFLAADNAGNFDIRFTNASFGQAAVITIPDPGVSAANMALEVDGTFTPVFTCATPGDLSVSYANQTGVYTKIGNQVTVNVRCQFTPTFSTASGEIRFSGLPFSVSAVNSIGWSGAISSMTGGFSWPASTSNIAILAAAGGAFCNVQASGSAVNTSALQMSGLTTGVQYQIVFTVTYRI